MERVGGTLLCFHEKDLVYIQGPERKIWRWWEEEPIPTHRISRISHLALGKSAGLQVSKKLISHYPNLSNSRHIYMHMHIFT